MSSRQAAHRQAEDRHVPGIYIDRVTAHIVGMRIGFAYSSGALDRARAIVWGETAARHYLGLGERQFAGEKPTPGEASLPVIAYDAQATEGNLAEAQGLFGDILTAKLKDVAGLSYHLMNQCTGLRGPEEVMLDMHTAPRTLHDAMAFFEQGHQHVLQQYVSQNLLSLNNDGTYQNSGGNGYTDELPAPCQCADRVRPRDMWASAESQEMAQVGPKQHAEFALRYEKQLLEPFGLTGYDCCEDLTHKLDDVLTIPHLRRISISPYANVDRCAARLKGDLVFSWKPRPADLVGDWDEQRIRSYSATPLRWLRRAAVCWR